MLVAASFACTSVMSSDMPFAIIEAQVTQDGASIGTEDMPS